MQPQKIVVVRDKHTPAGVCERELDAVSCTAQSRAGCRGHIEPMQAQAVGHSFGDVLVKMEPEHSGPATAVS